MKTKLHLIFLLSVFGNSIWAQNGVGVSYSTRIFPQQHRNNENSDYLRPLYVYKDSVSVSDAFEHNFSLHYEFKLKKWKNCVQQVGINTYFSKLIFLRQTCSDYYTYGTGWTAPHHVKDTLRQSGIYAYNFLGLNYALYKNISINERFSLRFGGEIELNFLVHKRLYDRHRDLTETYPEYSNWTDKTSDDNIVNPYHQPYNIRIGIPIYLRYKFKNNAVALGFSVGVSTQSRVLVNDVGLNLFASPTIGYTYFLK